MTLALPEKRRVEKSTYTLTYDVPGGTTPMNETRHETSYVWEQLGSPGQHRFACTSATQVIGEVWRTLKPGGGYAPHEWACKTLDGVVMRAARKEDAAHLLRKAVK